jgi:hypothetical protein
MTETNNLTVAHIKATVEHAYKNSFPLVLEGYVSADGSVSNMVVTFLGADGYKNALAHSLEMIASGRLDIKTAEGAEVGAQAAAALAASWSKSLHDLHAKRDYKETLDLESLGKQGFSINTKGQIVLKNMLVVMRDNEVQIDRNPGNTPLVRAKKEILARTPMSSFRGQLNLAPDRLRNIGMIELNPDDARVILNES